MSSKISIIIAVALLLLGGLAAWYVQGLRADNASLSASLAAAQALNESRARQLELMQSSLTVLEAARQAGEQKSGQLQQLVNQVRAAGAEKGDDYATVESSVALIIADKLNLLPAGLRQPTGDN